MQRHSTVEVRAGEHRSGKRTRAANRRQCAGSNLGMRFPPEVLSDAEARRLIDACGRCSLARARNRALLLFLYRTGCRVSEALQIREKDIDLDRCCARLLYCKGGGSRVVGIDKAACDELRAWLQRRSTSLPVHADRSRAPVFCTESAGPLLPGYVRRLMPRLARDAQIAKRVHAHGLRHTLAAQLREEGFDIGIISKQLGHRSIATTARYLDHIQPTAVIEAMRSRRAPGEFTSA